MIRYVKPHLRSGSVIAAVLALLLSASMTACLGTPTPSKPDGGNTDEAVTLPPVTMPDLTDDRKPTDMTPYAEKLESLFAETPIAPASDFTYEIGENGVTVTGYTGGELAVVIPDAIEDKPVIAIAEKAFADKGNLKAVSVPDSVVSVGFGAFENCKSMTSLKTPVFTCPNAPYFGALFGASSYASGGGAIPAGLAMLVLTGGETVPDYAFYACRGLTVVSLPDTVTEIGDFAFYSCSSLACITTADIPLTGVGERAFANCAALLRLELPATVTYMGSGMVEGCEKLEALTIPFVGGCTPDYPLTEEQKEAIEDGEAVHPARSSAYLGYLFGAASYTFTAGYLPASLITVTLAEGCTEIPANAFFECAAVREILLPEGVTSVGRRAFYGCESLASMTLPDSVQTVGDDAFHGCIRMTAFDGGKGLSELGVQCFMDCLSLTAVTLPDTLTHLPNSCFAGCRSLATLTANGVKTQGAQVFRHCEKLTGWKNTDSAHP